MRLRTALFSGLIIFAAVTGFARRVCGQDEYPLPKMSQNVRALTDIQTALLEPLDTRTAAEAVEQRHSRDGEKLEILNEATDMATDLLMAITDLLSVYENLESEKDRTIVKPFLQNRLRAYSHLLNLVIKKAAIPLGSDSQLATTERALKLRDELMAAKRKLDSIAASLN